MSRLELGERQPGWETVQRLALALGVEFTEFADPGIVLPKGVTWRPRGRPRKDGKLPTGPLQKPKKPIRAMPSTPPASELQAVPKKGRRKGAK